MNKQAHPRKFTAKQSARLGAYLAAGLGASTVATSTTDAAIVVIDIGPSGFNIGGTNGGVPPGGLIAKDNFPTSGAGTLRLFNNNGNSLGLDGNSGLQFASSAAYASPRNFALNQTIDGAAAIFTDDSSYTVFRYYDIVSPDFGPNSYMGFKTAANNFGWLEVTWVSNSRFEILSGAYEDRPNVAILAGNAAPIPEPGTWVAMAVLAGGAAFARWRKRRDEAA